MVRGSARSEETIKEEKLCGRERYRTIQVAKYMKKNTFNPYSNFLIPYSLIR